MRTTFLLGVLVPFLGSGCAWVPQHATLRLDPRITPSTIGEGHTVALRISDKRASPTLGYRGVDSKGAAITTVQDVRALFRNKFTEGLIRKGFRVTTYEGQPGLLLSVEIRQIEYTTDMEFWKGLVLVKAELRAIATMDGARFEHAYLAERKEPTVEAPGAETNERLINGVISDAVRKLFEDERLLLFLSE